MKRHLLIALALPACLIAKRDNVCDPSSHEYNADACRSACNQVICGPGEGPVVRDGCECVACVEIECGANEYREECRCVGLHEPSVFVSGLNNITTLATDDYVYYSDSGTYDDHDDGSIKRIALDGSGMLAYYENGPDETAGLTIDGNQLYWCKTDYPSELRFALIDQPGTFLVKTIGTEFSRYCSASPLAVGGALYAWVWIPGGPYELHRLQGANDDVIDTTINARNFAANSTWLFYVDQNMHIRRVPLAGGATQPVADGPAPGAMAADDVEIFWTADGGIFHVSVDGGTATMLSGPAKVESPIHLDATHVYWINESLYRAPRGGGSAENLATIDHGEKLTGNSTALYVTSYTGGDYNDKIWRVRK